MRYRVVQLSPLEIYRVQVFQTRRFFKDRWIDVGTYHYYRDGGRSWEVNEFATQPEACARMQVLIRRDIESNLRAENVWTPKGCPIIL